MEKFANKGGILPEQLWDTDDLPEAKMKRGGPTGSAMPLCWAHAEYVSLVRSHKDGVCFDRIEPVYQRYAKAQTDSQIEMWTLAHQPQRVAQGKITYVTFIASVFAIFCHEAMDEIRPSPLCI